MKKVIILNKQGFALIATISIASLILFITLALVSLSTVVTKTSNHSHHIQIARANARLALSEAVSNLQESLGPDTRVSANSSIISTTQQKHVLGVWDSIGSDSLEPNYGWGATTSASQLATYVDHRTPKFKKWLIPGAPDTGSAADKMDYYVNSSPSLTDIILVGEGTVGAGNPDLHVTAPLMEIKQDATVTGGYSWWISGENQKVRVALETSVASSVSGQVHASVSAPNTNPNITPDLSLYNEAEAGKHITLNTVLFNSTAVQLPASAKKHFHTISPYSEGLLTNTAKGGLKKDLNLVTDLGSTHTDINTHIAHDTTSYSYLKEYMISYKNNANWGKVEWVSGVPHYSPGYNLNNMTVARLGWKDNMIVNTKSYVVLSTYAAIDAGAGTWPDGSDKYILRLYYNLVDEYWNPFSLPYLMPRNTSGSGTDIYYLKKLWSLPYSITYFKNDVLMPECDTDGRPILAQISAQNGAGGQTHNSIVHFDRVFQPGEVRVYSDDSTTPTATGQSINFTEGWDPSGGVYTEMLGNNGEKLYFKATDFVEPEIHKSTDTTGYVCWDYAEGWPPTDAPGHAAYFFDIFIQDGVGWHEYAILYQDRESDGTRNADGIAASIPRNGSNKKQILSMDSPSKRQPFALFGVRRKCEQQITPTLASPTLKSQLLKSKYFLFSNYLNSDMYITNNDANIAHSPYEFFVQQVSSFSDYPFIDVDPYNKGYMGTSVGSQTPYAGQTNVVMQEIPFQPLVSMGQLQHARLGEINDNRVNSHPTVNMAFGNSYASPFNEANTFRTKRSTWPNPQTFTSAGAWYNDKSFMLNEALWDKWFMSSISDQTNPFVDSPLQHTSRQIIEHSLAGTRELPNKRYVFTTKRSGTRATTLTDDLMAADGFKKVAEHITCKGAFNVNSTNVDAWRAFLTSLDGQTLAILDYETNALKTHNAQYYISRYSLPTTDPADTVNYSTAQQQFLDRRWQGARKLTGTEIDELATAMVAQVKLRGPFLSLADFVNRQLRATDSIHQRHLKGAVQAAIDSTSINASFTSSSSNVTTADVAGYGYAFPEAGTGLASEGAPGYITQADLLTPIASQLRVRDDSFVVRAYGESVQNGQVMARAYCEAVVKRGYDYVDPSDSANKELNLVNGSAVGTLSATNQTYGRKFKIVLFRWLNPQEI